jgi:2-polyprenyl-3-methyl-5-hydroxy-6-metoxy-1,4-benzoquinol methylase
MNKSVEDVREFWERNPLWSGESSFVTGSREYFEEHRRVYIADVFAGHLDQRIFPDPDHRDSVLDLGCGPGFWTVELGLRGCQQLVAADLTTRALDLAARRCDIYGVDARFSFQNAESMSFDSETFSHVNCQGVIHHTPNATACVAEIARVLRPNGTALISVYYRNILLRNWRGLSWCGRIAARAGWGLAGRGRERMLMITDPDELVRMYDGAANPIGKAYSAIEFRQMVEPYLQIRHLFVHFFPARAIPFRIPGALHRLLDRRAGFMLYASVARR